jgi:predicted DNA-binding transcriptional regulator YafY
MRLQRLIAILLLIESRGHMKAKELAQALETSVRTIYRDIEALCEAGVPLVAMTGPNGGVSLMEGYQVAMNHLYSDDVINL